MPRPVSPISPCFPRLYHMSPCRSRFPLCPTVSLYPQHVPCVPMSPVCSHYVHHAPSVSLCPQHVHVSQRSPYPFVSHVSVHHHHVPQVPMLPPCLCYVLLFLVFPTYLHVPSVPILSLCPCCVPCVPITSPMCPCLPAAAYLIRLGTLEQGDAADVEWRWHPYTTTARKRQLLSLT